MSGPKGFGLGRELDNAKRNKYDEEKEEQTRVWMEKVTEKSMVEGVTEQLGWGGFHEALKDGSYLCELANKLGGKIEIDTNEQKTNIGNFVSFCIENGVREYDMFETDGLYEGTDMGSVVNGIHILAEIAYDSGKTTHDIER